MYSHCHVTFHCVSTPQFIYSTVDRYLGNFQFLVIMNNAALTIHVFQDMQICLLSGIFSTWEGSH